MALPKKNSRIITIDEIAYRWVVGPTYNGYNIFYAQKEGVKEKPKHLQANKMQASIVYYY